MAVRRGGKGFSWRGGRFWSTSRGKLKTDSLAKQDRDLAFDLEIVKNSEPSRNLKRRRHDKDPLSRKDDSFATCCLSTTTQVMTKQTSITAQQEQIDNDSRIE